MTRKLKVHICKAAIWYIAAMITPEFPTWKFAIIFTLCVWRMAWHLHFLTSTEQ